MIRSSCLSRRLVLAGAAALPSLAAPSLARADGWRPKQALRIVVPALMGAVIGTLKDTSLVTIVGLFELTGALGLALGGDPVWRPFYLEGYLFLALAYWVLCFGLSRYSGWLERRLNGGRA